MRLFFKALVDLYRQHFKARSIKVGSFAFLVHPRNIDDVSRKYPIFKRLPNFLTTLFTRLLWPVTLSNITGLKNVSSGEEINGWVISVPLTARQMTLDRALALKRIRQAVRLAENKGATLIGLGALTSSFSRGGLDLIEHTSAYITTGHAYTAYNIVEYARIFIDKLGPKKSNVSIAVVGSSGSVGSTVMSLLARENFKSLFLIDLGRKLHITKEKLIENNLHNDNRIKISSELSDIKKAHIVITATNAPETVIRNNHLSSGTVIIDDAQPSDVEEEVFDNKGVLVIEAGAVKTPNITSNFNFGLANRDDNFCCLAEVMILSSIGWDDHYVINRPTIDMVDSISIHGKRLNFRPGDIQNHRGLVQASRINNVIELVKSRLDDNL